MDWNNSGYPQMQSRMRIVPKSEIKNALSYYLSQTTGRYVTKLWEVEEIAVTCRHACASNGISTLNQEQFSYCGVTIPYWFCRSCGSLRVWLDYN